MRKSKILIIIIIFLIMLIAVIIGGRYMFLKEKPKNSKTETISSTSSETTLTVEDIEVTETVTEEAKTESTVSVITPSENVDIVSDNRTDEKVEEITEPIMPVSSENTEKSNDEEKKYVQDADIEKGVSWDGESAILYRLMSGETTYEKTYGAYYEIRPDEWILLENPTPKEKWDGNCNHCGKIAGDGTNDTCVRWMMDDQICPNCKAEVTVNTCHTCKED